LYYWRWAHNEFYQWITETGVLGGLAVIGLLINLFRRINEEQKYHLLVIIALSMVHPIFHSPRLIPYLILLLSFYFRRNSVES
jgi:O-antigen ligase